MNKAILIDDISSLNTSEATFGDMFIFGNTLIIPYYNVKVNSNGNLKKEDGKYLNYCYLLFEGTMGIVWDYEVSRFMNAETRKCYGGIYIQDGEYYEFWITYDKGFVIMKEDYLSSKNPWSIKEELDGIFSCSNNDIIEIKTILIK
jgi:hypothetical protein